MVERQAAQPENVTPGLVHKNQVRRNLTTGALYEEIVKHREGQIAHLGPMVVRTGHDAEVPPGDKFIVKDSVSESKVCWDNTKNELSGNYFNTLYNRLVAYMYNKTAYVQDCMAGSVEEHAIPMRIITETAWHSLFARNMFYQAPEASSLENFHPDFTVVHVPGFHAIPELDGTRSASFVIVSLEKKMVLIGGTSYAGEIKQAVFTMVNHMMPADVFVMRCSANVGPEDDVAIFMGREETGKTTLAVDPARSLLGDHSHGWSEKGVFNLDWGGYAKLCGIREEDQPYIYSCTRKFGTLLENVSINPDTRRIDTDDNCLTENTRAAYPIAHLPHAIRKGLYGHPKNLFLLTVDAFGVLPPIARLTPEQAVYAFLSAYTARFRPTETGKMEPEVMFDVCFGDAALALPAYEYGRRLLEKIQAHGIHCWLVNTGWSGEPYTRGERIRIGYTRALIRAAISGEFHSVKWETDPVFQFEVPLESPDESIPAKMLNPRSAAADPGEYEMRANRLVAEFVKDFGKFEEEIPEDMRVMLSQVISVDEDFDFDDYDFKI